MAAGTVSRGAATAKVQDSMVAGTVSSRGATAKDKVLVADLAGVVVATQIKGTMVREAATDHRAALGIPIRNIYQVC